MPTDSSCFPLALESSFAEQFRPDGTMQKILKSTQIPHIMAAFCYRTIAAYVADCLKRLLWIIFGSTQTQDSSRS
jgi:hypothetical protein